MSPSPRHLSFHFEGFDEACLSFGEVGALRSILIVPPLFDEMNRVRAMLVAAMRGLAERGMMTMLPDLPGCNESLAPVSSQSVQSWQGAMLSAAHQLGATHIASIRGGSLIATQIRLPHWSLASVKGASLVKTMLRTRIASDKEAGRTSSIETLMSEARTGPIDLAGYALGPDMLAGLEAAVPGEASVAVTLGDESGQLSGRPLWLRAEPQEDADMSAALAAELDRWSASCGG